MMTIACTQMKMTAEEALCAVTLNPARSLCREQIIGSIEVGKQADIALWEAPDYDYIPYHYGESLVRMVFKRGELDFNSR
jgi:imidazolonepropionase